MPHPDGAGMGPGPGRQTGPVPLGGTELELPGHPRESGPIVPIDDAFFHHEEDLLRAADAKRKGAFEAAHGGTLFLSYLAPCPRGVSSLAAAMGTVKEKTLPRPSWLSAQIRPPCASTRPLQMASPSPAPRRSRLSPCQ